MAWQSVSSTILLVLIAQASSQFLDFFGFPEIAQSANIFRNEHTTTKKPKLEVININHEPQIVTWNNTSILFTYDSVARDSKRRLETAKEEKRKQQTTRLSILNFYTSSTTQKSVRKTTKLTNRRNTTTITENARKKIVNNAGSREILPYDMHISKNAQISDWYERPINNVGSPTKPYYETSTKASSHNNYNSKVVYNVNDYTTKQPYYNRPGVKPVILDDRPPITNRPATKKPQYQRPSYTQRPYTQMPYSTETERPNMQKPYNRPDIDMSYTERPQTPRPVTNKPTVRPYVVNPIPTDAGAVVFPHEDQAPEIIRGPDEDYMSEAEKRRYIEVAERMCDKYKQLNTKQLAAIPLLPSPEPVSVNVSKCTPTQIPLVVGGKVVTIKEFPHMALLGWVKLDGGGYSWKCGGSLISDQFVLTAAHCSYEERDNTVFTGPPRVVQLGSSYLDDPGALVVRVAGIIRHPKYKFPRSYHDLAVVKLVQPVTFSEVIKPACLGVPPAVDEPIIATGWGKTEFGGDQSVELRSVSLPVWDINRCHEILGTSRKMPQGPRSESQMCAGERRGGKDTCQGDSGGPAQLQDGCMWRVVAVTSLGRSCGAPNTPGLYALVQRAFVSAVVFGTNHKIPNNDQTLANNDYKPSYSNPSHNNPSYNDYENTQGYQTNANRQATTEAYYNHNQNNNRRTTTTTTTEAYYHNDQNHRLRTTNIEAYYYNNHENHHPKTKMIEAYYSLNNNRITTTTSTEAYYNYNHNQNNNRRTTTESYNPPQNDYYNIKRTDTYNQPNVYSNNQNSRGILDTDVGFYDQQKDQNYNNNNQGYNNQGYNNNNNQPQNDYWGSSGHQEIKRSDDRFEQGRIWFT